MTNILLTLSYDGRDFCGWQIQKTPPGTRTVQGCLEEALEKMLKTHVNVQGSGRTDSGVHAMGQAANFFSPYDNIDCKNYLRALNGLLPPDIRIMNVEKKDMSFSSRFSATSRSYRYFIQTKNPPFARDSRYVWFIPNRPDAEKLNAMSSILLGEKDFATFTASGDKSLSTKRYVEKAHWWYQSEDLLVFEIEANAFLWKMVRSITGTLIECEKNNCSVEDFKKLFESRQRKNAGLTAPPDGLFLWQVKFDGIRRHV